MTETLTLRNMKVQPDEKRETSILNPNHSLFDFQVGRSRPICGERQPAYSGLQLFALGQPRQILHRPNILDGVRFANDELPHARHQEPGSGREDSDRKGDRFVDDHVEDHCKSSIEGKQLCSGR